MVAKNQVRGDEHDNGSDAWLSWLRCGSDRSAHLPSGDDRCTARALAGMGAVRPLPNHVRTAIRCAGHREQLLLGWAVGHRVRTVPAAIHLAVVALRPDPRLPGRAGRLVHRLAAEGSTDRRRLGTGEHAALAADQRLLRARRGADPAVVDAAVTGARASVVTAPTAPSAVADARGSPPRSPPRPTPAHSATPVRRSRSSAPASPDRPSTAHPRYRSPSPGSSGSPRTYARSSASRCGR